MDGKRNSHKTHETMPTVITASFATPTEVAKRLGVPKRRAEWLMNLMSPAEARKNLLRRSGNRKISRKGRSKRGRNSRAQVDRLGR